MYSLLLRKAEKKKLSAEEQELLKGLQMVYANPILKALKNRIAPLPDSRYSKGTIAVTESNGTIYLNQKIWLSAAQWMYAVAHCAFHHVFGHFDLEKVPGYYTEQKGENRLKIADFQYDIWNLACDIYVAKFLAEFKMGEPLGNDSFDWLPGNIVTEEQIYQYLLEQKNDTIEQRYGTAGMRYMDMIGLEIPKVYKYWPNQNPYKEAFYSALERQVLESVDKAGGYEPCRYRKNLANQASRWFIDHYPLLGGLAASFQIVEDSAYCAKAQIQVAAICISEGKIYANPAAGLSEEEWRFVLAHEYLHAGLNHHRRCQGREFAIWNIACDFVINSWLVEMNIGAMPSIGLLYDPELDKLSAETIYDMLIENMRKTKKLATFRGYGKGDMLEPQAAGEIRKVDYTTFDEICREALLQGLDYHNEQGRGYLPAGLVEEIRALSMPPVPWDVKLAQWFQEYIIMPEKKRSYVRPSRRQGATPDIPRPRYIMPEEWQNTHTFGVIIDTSGSMNKEMLAKALGAVASYAAAREVHYVRVVFCDAAAYDGGYMTVEELASKVEVKGRGGTRLQPAVDLLEKTDDFPKDAPVLLITDGMIEPHIDIKRKHAWLIADGKRLPFQTKATVFYYS